MTAYSNRVRNHNNFFQRDMFSKREKDMIDIIGETPLKKRPKSVFEIYLIAQVVIIS